MKVVINVCFGGFSLSPKAVARMAELQGRPCFFYRNVRTNGKPDFRKYELVSMEDAPKEFVWYAFDIPDADKNVLVDHGEASQEQREAWNAEYERHKLDNRFEIRHDPILVRVVEELGEDANGSCAELSVVEIPDGTDYEVEEYDGNEHIAEKHRTWR